MVWWCHLSRDDYFVSSSSLCQRVLADEEARCYHHYPDQQREIHHLRMASVSVRWQPSIPERIVGTAHVNKEKREKQNNHSNLLSTKLAETRPSVGKVLQAKTFGSTSALLALFITNWVSLVSEVSGFRFPMKRTLFLAVGLRLVSAYIYHFVGQCAALWQLANAALLTAARILGAWLGQSVYTTNVTYIHARITDCTCTIVLWLRLMLTIRVGTMNFKSSSTVRILKQLFCSRGLGNGGVFWVFLRGSRLGGSCSARLGPVFVSILAESSSHYFDRSSNVYSRRRSQSEASLCTQHNSSITARHSFQLWLCPVGMFPAKAVGSWLQTEFTAVCDLGVVGILYPRHLKYSDPRS